MYENLPISLSSHKNNMSKVSHYNTVYFLRYIQSILWKVCLQTYRVNRICWKVAYFIRKMQTSRVNNSKILKIKNMKFMRTTRVFFLYEPTDIVNFSNLHQCTFKQKSFSRNNCSKDFSRFRINIAGADLLFEI